MKMKFVTVGLLSVAAAGARGQFVPGHLYVAEPTVKACSPFYPSDRIWEIDLQTGAYELFAQIPYEFCGGISSLIFTPDGQRLRTVSFLTARVLEFDGQANMSIVYDNSDGVFSTGGGGITAYDAQGNFFLSNGGAPNILKFIGDQPPGTVFADINDGVPAAGAIAVAPNGDVYFGTGLNAKAQIVVLRFSPDGTPSVFDNLGPSVDDLAFDSQGNLFALVGPTIYRYSNYDPSSQVLIGSFPALTNARSMSLTLDESSLIIPVAGSVYALSLSTGELEQITTMSLTQFFGSGSAIYVPEPSGPIMLLLASAMLLGRQRSLR